MPSANLIAQSLLSGLFVGGLYGLLGLGVSLSWRFLRIINLAHFALVSLSAYLTYQLVEAGHLSPALALVALVPLFFLVGVALQLLFARLEVGEFASVLVTFGLMILVETLIQWIWTADFRRIETPYATASFRVGSIYVPIVEAWVFAVAVALAIATWAWLRFSYAGKALRASADDAAMAAAFGIDHRRLALLIAGIGAASGAIAGTAVAINSTLSPVQANGWIGVVLATVILGGLGNPLGLLLAALGIGVTEALTMAVMAPTWAPVVSFTLLILILVLRPNRV